MEQSAGAGNLYVGANFGSQHTGEQTHLDRVSQHVFAVAVAVFQAAEQADQLGVESTHPDLKGGLFAGTPDGFVNVADCSVDTLLDAGGLYAPIFDQLGKSQFCDLSANRVETG